MLLANQKPRILLNLRIIDVIPPYIYMCVCVFIIQLLVLWETSELLSVSGCIRSSLINRDNLTSQNTHEIIVVYLISFCSYYAFVYMYAKEENTYCLNYQHQPIMSIFSYMTSVSKTMKSQLLKSFTRISTGFFICHENESS